MSETAFRPMVDFQNPGFAIKIDCLEPAGLTVTDGAKSLGVSRQALSKLINGTASGSPEMALRLAKAFGSTPEQWLRLQQFYDLAHYQKPEASSYQTIDSHVCLSEAYFLK